MSSRANGASYGALAITAAMLAVSIYWRFIDTEPPVRVDYSHTLPLSEAASTKAEAEAFSLDAVIAGQSFYRYVEYCLDREVSGTVQSYLVSLEDGTIIPLKNRQTLAKPGCFKRSFREVVPAIVPPGRYEHRIWIDYDINPLRKARMEGITVYLNVVQP
jgi:hypothetical protein